MNLPPWCSTTKIIVSFLNADLNDDRSDGRSSS
jgi:hypothetical protein